MRSRVSGGSKLVILGDLCAIAISYVIALYCRYSIFEGYFSYPAVFRTDVLYRSFYLSLGLMQLFFSLIYHMYRKTEVERLCFFNPIERMREVLKRVAFQFFCMIVVLFVAQQASFVSRSVVGIYFLILIMLMTIIREIEYRYCRKNIPRQKHFRVVVVSDQVHLNTVIGQLGCSANQTIKHHINDKEKKLEVVAYFTVEELQTSRAKLNQIDYQGVICYLPQLGSDERKQLQQELELSGSIYWLVEQGQFTRFEQIVFCNKDLLVREPQIAKYVPVLGIQYPVTNISEAVGWANQTCDALKGKYICFSNVHTTITAQDDPEYLSVLNDAAMTFPDGTPIVKAQRKAGCEEAQRVAGPDFMEEMFLQTVGRDKTHFFYGSTQETLDALRKNLKKHYPKLKIAGMYSPPFRTLTEEEDAEIVRMIREADADYIWIGLGAPKQEKWMAAHQGLFRGVMLGVGAGFDFHAGTIQRAPKWIQAIGFEWLYRFLQDPKRLWKRYLVTNIKFICYMAKERHKK